MTNQTTALREAVRDLLALCHSYQLADHDRVCEAEALLAQIAESKPKVNGKPKIQIDRDPSQLDDAGLRAYYKQNDLYYSALFHARRLALDTSCEVIAETLAPAFASLAADVLTQGNTAALKAEYLDLYTQVQRARRTRQIDSAPLSNNDPGRKVYCFCANGHGLQADKFPYNRVPLGWIRFDGEPGTYETASQKAERAVRERAVHCRTCHGTYDPRGPNSARVTGFCSRSCEEDSLRHGEATS